MRILVLFISTFLFNLLPAQISAYQLDWQKQVDYEQNRIDIMDGDLDGIIQVGNLRQSTIATELYLIRIDSMQKLIAQKEKFAANQYCRALYEFLKKLQRADVNHLSSSHRNIDLLVNILTLNDEAKELELLKTDIRTALNISDIINLKPYAKEYWVFAAGFYPTDVLNAFKNLAYSPLGNDVILELSRIAPGAIKQYFGSNHLIDRAIKNSKDSIAVLLYSIYNQYGAQSKSYALIEYISKGQMKLKDAETISKNPRRFFKTLIELRKRPNILADYTVEKELETLGMERVVEINLRHEDKDEYRFAPIDNDNAYEIYTSIIYCPQEIFTSSFLGMYSRMMEKRKEKSGYEFLQTLGFNKFRVFIKQCAGYNKLDDFFSTMNDSQANALISQFAGGLYNYGGDLGPAVDVADTYGSLEDEKIKAIFERTIKQEFRSCLLNNNAHGIKIYGLLLKLSGGNPNDYTQNYAFNIPNLDQIPNVDLFPDGKHVQQHFFFDDEDGENAFNNWLGLYPSSIYKKEDKGTYIVFTSIKGKEMKIYANKPHSEIEGRKDLQKHFEKYNRFPDLIVHRGHSYYIENTLDQMTNSNKIAILGSCGGYQNISKAMENAIDVQIISTKQVGTLAVNVVLIQEITETIRSGKDLIWPDVWQQIATKL
ncbi:MAG: hypothetical protein R2852_01625, partial [Bacteroidia bacterium]